LNESEEAINEKVIDNPSPKRKRGKWLFNPSLALRASELFL
jgi:hypothetical protein